MTDKVDELLYGRKIQSIIENLREEFELLGEDYNEKNIKLLVYAINKSIADTNNKQFKKVKTDGLFGVDMIRCGEVVSALCFVLEQEHKKMIGEDN